MSCNNNCVVCPVLDFSGPGELHCDCDSKPDFLNILASQKEVVLHTNGRAFYYKGFTEKVRPRVKKIVLHYFGRNEAEHDQNTRVSGSYEQAKIGEENIRQAGIPIEVHRVFSPSYHKTRYDHPEEVVIELSRDCNFSCPTCFNSFRREGVELSTAYVREIIDSVADAKIARIRFSGGEPLLRKDLFLLMEYARTKGLTIWLNTNASLVTEDITRKLEKYVENILVPFNGYDEQSDQNWTMTKGSFEKKLAGMRILKKRIPMLRAGTVGTADNIENLEKIFELVKHLDSWELWRPVQENDFNPEILCDKLVKLSLQWSRLIPIANRTPFCSHEKKMDVMCLGGCFDDGHSRVIVDPKGYAKPSYFLDKNIGDPRDIMSCWNNEFMVKMRNLEFVQDGCKTCDYLEKCKGKIFKHLA